MSSDKQRDTVYIDRVHRGDYYAKMSGNIMIAISVKYDLTRFASLLLQKFIIEYDSVVSQHKEDFSQCTYSYGDLAELCGTSRNTIATAVTELKYHELITLKRASKGRTKTTFIPNVELLHTILDEHLKWLCVQAHLH